MAKTWVYSDGGRAAAGLKGHGKDCVTRAIAIATGRAYRNVAGLVDSFGREERVTRRRIKKGRSSADSGVYKPTTRRIMAHLGWRWVPTMGIGTGCRVHLKASQLPKGRLVVKLSKHVCAVIDGVIYDTYDPSRRGTRCVYGYWTK